MDQTESIDTAGIETSPAPLRTTKYVAVDFDGTCVFHSYPECGPDVPGAVAALQRLHQRGIKLLLWTCRDRAELQDAVNWFTERGLPLSGINQNPDFPQMTGPKLYADFYIDDKALGTYLVSHLNPLKDVREMVVNWERLMWVLEKDGFFESNYKLTPITPAPAL